MKKLLLISLYLFSFTVSFAQWEFQNPVPTNTKINDVFFVDENHGWAVGEYFTILHTIDGGLTWTEQLSAEENGWYTYSRFNSVHFTDLDNGWAVGQWFMPYGGGVSGIAYYTNNGGVTWNGVEGLPDSKFFCDVQFINSSEGWLIDEAGKILHTPDGGENFTIQFDDSTQILKSIHLIDSDNGWASGDEGLILHTSDGGETWTEQESGVLINLSSIFFIDQNNGWAVGNTEDNWPPDATILYTTDGGNSWEVNFVGSSMYSSFGKVYFTDINHGWVTLNTTFYGAHILSTSDGGESWEINYLGIQLNSMQSVYFIDGTNGWATGDNIILHTSDAGENWQSQNSITNFNLNDVYFIDDENGWVVGSLVDMNEGVYWNTKIVLKTVDGGTNWLPVEIGEPGWGVGLNSVLFSDDKHGWIWGSDDEGCLFFRTVDGGLTWQQDLTCISALYFIDSLNGWRSNGGYIYITNDGGVSWHDEFELEVGIGSIFFINELKGWAVGNDCFIYNTTDGGINWQLQFSEPELGYLKSVYFINEDYGWAVGYNHTILHTSDGGENWTVQNSESHIPYLTSVFFVSEKKGWIVGKEIQHEWLSSGYEILYTENSGNDWIIQDHRPCGGLNAIQFIDEDYGWTVGVQGQIMHTNNGGLLGFLDPMIQRSESILITTVPNPFTTSTTIEYSLTQPQAVTITFYNQFGEQVDRMEHKQPAGKHQMVWTPENIPAGMYYFTLQAGDEVSTGKVVKISE